MFNPGSFSAGSSSLGAGGRGSDSRGGTGGGTGSLHGGLPPGSNVNLEQQSAGYRNPGLIAGNHVNPYLNMGFPAAAGALFSAGLGGSTGAAPDPAKLYASYESLVGLAVGGTSDLSQQMGLASAGGSMGSTFGGQFSRSGMVDGQGSGFGKAAVSSAGNYANTAGSSSGLPNTANFAMVQSPYAGLSGMGSSLPGWSYGASNHGALASPATPYGNSAFFSPLGGAAVDKAGNLQNQLDLAAMSALGGGLDLGAGSIPDLLQQQQQQSMSHAVPNNSINQSSLGRMQQQHHQQPSRSASVAPTNPGCVQRGGSTTMNMNNRPTTGSSGHSSSRNRDSGSSSRGSMIVNNPNRRVDNQTPSSHFYMPPTPAMVQQPDILPPPTPAPPPPARTPQQQMKHQSSVQMENTVNEVHKQVLQHSPAASVSHQPIMLHSPAGTQHHYSRPTATERPSRQQQQQALQATISSVASAGRAPETQRLVATTTPGPPKVSPVPASNHSQQRSSHSNSSGRGFNSVESIMAENSLNMLGSQQRSATISTNTTLGGFSSHDLTKLLDCQINYAAMQLQQSAATSQPSELQRPATSSHQQLSSAGNLPLTPPSYQQNDSRASVLQHQQHQHLSADRAIPTPSSHRSQHSHMTDRPPTANHFQSQQQSHEQQNLSMLAQQQQQNFSSGATGNNFAFMQDLVGVGDHQHLDLAGPGAQTMTQTPVSSQSHRHRGMSPGSAGLGSNLASISAGPISSSSGGGSSFQIDASSFNFLLDAFEQHQSQQQQQNGSQESSHQPVNLSSEIGSLPFSSPTNTTTVSSGSGLGAFESFAPHPNLLLDREPAGHHGMLLGGYSASSSAPNHDPQSSSLGAHASSLGDLPHNFNLLDEIAGDSDKLLLEDAFLGQGDASSHHGGLVLHSALEFGPAQGIGLGDSNSATEGLMDFGPQVSVSQLLKPAPGSSQSTFTASGSDFGGEMSAQGGSTGQHVTPKLREKMKMRLEKELHLHEVDADFNRHLVAVAERNEGSSASEYLNNQSQSAASLSQQGPPSSDKSSTSVAGQLTIAGQSLCQPGVNEFAASTHGTQLTMAPVTTLFVSLPSYCNSSTSRTSKISSGTTNATDPLQPLPAFSPVSFSLTPADAAASQAPPTFRSVDQGVKVFVPPSPFGPTSGKSGSAGTDQGSTEHRIRPKRIPIYRQQKQVGQSGHGSLGEVERRGSSSFRDPEKSVFPSPRKSPAVAVSGAPASSLSGYRARAASGPRRTPRSTFEPSSPDSPYSFPADDDAHEDSRFGVDTKDSEKQVEEEVSKKLMEISSLHPELKIPQGGHSPRSATPFSKRRIFSSARSTRVNLGVADLSRPPATPTDQKPDISATSPASAHLQQQPPSTPRSQGLSGSGDEEFTLNRNLRHIVPKKRYSQLPVTGNNLGPSGPHYPSALVSSQLRGASSVIDSPYPTSATPAETPEAMIDSVVCSVVQLVTGRPSPGRAGALSVSSPRPNRRGEHRKLKTPKPDPHSHFELVSTSAEMENVLQAVKDPESLYVRPPPEESPETLVEPHSVKFEEFGSPNSMAEPSDASAALRSPFSDSHGQDGDELRSPGSETEAKPQLILRISKKCIQQPAESGTEQPERILGDRLRSSDAMDVQEDHLMAESGADFQFSDRDLFTTGNPELDEKPPATVAEPPQDHSNVTAAGSSTVVLHRVKKKRHKHHHHHHKKHKHKRSRAERVIDDVISDVTGSARRHKKKKKHKRSRRDGEEGTTVRRSTRKRTLRQLATPTAETNPEKEERAEPEPPLPPSESEPEDEDQEWYPSQAAAKAAHMKRMEAARSRRKRRRLQHQQQQQNYSSRSSTSTHATPAGRASPSAHSSASSSQLSHSTAESGTVLPKGRSGLVGRVIVATVANMFQKGSFIVAKEDVDKLSNAAPLWRVDNQNLLQKFVSTANGDGSQLYQSTPTYTGWCSEHAERYLPVTVRYVEHSRAQSTVALLTSMSELVPPAVTTEIESVEAFGGLSPPECDQHGAGPSPSVLFSQDFHALEKYLHACVLQALNKGFWAEALTNWEFSRSIHDVESLNLEKKAKLLNSVQWSSTFQENLEWYPYLSANEAETSGLSCQACEKGSVASSVQVYGDPYDPQSLESRQHRISATGSPIPSLEFHVCKYCADLAVYYHKLYHLRYIVYRKCQDKVELIVEEAGPNVETALVTEQCLRNRTWVSQVVQEFIDIWQSIS